MSTPGSVHCDGNTNAIEHIQEQSELEHPPPLPPPSRKPLPKVPPIGPNGRFLLYVMNGYICGNKNVSYIQGKVRFIGL